MQRLQSESSEPSPYDRTALGRMPRAEATARYESLWAAPPRRTTPWLLAAALSAPVAGASVLLWLKHDTKSSEDPGTFGAWVALLAVLLWTADAIRARDTRLPASRLAAELRGLAAGTGSVDPKSTGAPFESIASRVLTTRRFLELETMQSRRLSLFGLWFLAAPYADTEEQDQLAAVATRRRAVGALVPASLVAAAALVLTAASASDEDRIWQLNVAALAGGVVAIGALIRAGTASRQLHQLKLLIVFRHASEIVADLDVRHVIDDPVTQLVEVNRLVLLGAPVTTSRSSRVGLNAAELQRAVEAALETKSVVDISGEFRVDRIGRGPTGVEQLRATVLTGSHARGEQDGAVAFASFAVDGGRREAIVDLALGVDAIGWDVLLPGPSSGQIATVGGELRFDVELAPLGDEPDSNVYLTLYCEGRFLESVQVEVRRS